MNKKPKIYKVNVKLPSGEVTIWSAKADSEEQVKEFIHDEYPEATEIQIIEAKEAD